MSEISGKLRILQVQNRHAPGWGGEETVVALEKQLLQDRGHVVDDFHVSNLRLKNANIFRQMLAAPGFLWSRRCYTMLRRKIVEFEPDVVHVHNTFPELSPSVFWAARREGVPVVQTLHNFRHVCANTTLFRDGRRCEKCVGRLGWSAIRHGCYANSTARTAVVVARNVLHRGLGTYARAVDAYITLNNFNREIFRRGGIPENKLIAKANFVPASQLGNTQRKPQAIFCAEPYFCCCDSPAQNVGRRRLRTLFLGLSVTMAVGVGFAAFVTGWSLRDGIATSFSRMGADLVVVPVGTLVNITSTLLTVQPTDQELDASLGEKLFRLPESSGGTQTNCSRRRAT